MTKTYGIDNVVEASYLFPAMKGHLRANFTGGVLDERRRRPATLTTKNPVAMLILENTEMFKSGRMFIVAQTEDPVTPKEIEAAAKKAEPKKKTKADKVTDDGRKVYDNVTTVGDAVTILLELGAKAAALQDTATMLETAAQLNVSFPNLKLK